MRRRAAVAALAALAGCAAVLAADAFLVAPGRLAVTRHRLRSPGGGARRVRLVQLSDLHLRRVGRHERRVARAVTALRPDLVLLTGDAVEHTDALPLLGRFLDLLAPDTPKLAILGNWEYWGHVDVARLAATYATRNARLLRNESVRLRAAGAELLVTGLDDFIAGRPDLQRALHGQAPCANHLLLAHCPAHRDVLPARWRGLPTLADGPAGAAPGVLPGLDGGVGDAAALPTPVAMLSGHTHGGQVAPFGVALWRPPGSGPYVRGWYHETDGIPLYVSVGLGTSTIPARLGAVPEVAVFEWEAG